MTLFGCRWIFAAKDSLNRNVLIFPIAAIDALTITASIAYQCFCRNFIEKIETDQGSHFRNNC